MVLTFPIGVTMGFILGFLAGLGIGGGSLLMMWLTLVVGMEPMMARCVNLMFFIPCALCSSLLRLKKGHLKKILLPMALGCVTAAGCSYIGNLLDTAVLKKIFGILLLFTGIRELRYQSKH